MVIETGGVRTFIKSIFREQKGYKKGRNDIEVVVGNKSSTRTRKLFNSNIVYSYYVTEFFDNPNEPK